MIEGIDTSLYVLTRKSKIEFARRPHRGRSCGITHPSLAPPRCLRPPPALYMLGPAQVGGLLHMRRWPRRPTPTPTSRRPTPPSRISDDYRSTLILVKASARIVVRQLPSGKVLAKCARRLCLARTCPHLSRGAAARGRGEGGMGWVAWESAHQLRHEV